MEYEFENFEELKQLVQKSGDVFTVTMEDLREVQGAGKLGKYVISGIKDNLDGQGLKTFPKDLPATQHQCVRLYSAGSPVGKLFSAMFELGNWDEMESNHDSDQHIRDIVSGGEQEILSQIRQLVCN